MATIRSSVAGDRDEDAGEDRARLVAGRRAGDLGDRLDEGGGGQRDDAVGRRLGHRGERREVVGAQRADVEARRARDDLDVLLGGAQLERDGAARAAGGRCRASGGREARRCPRARPSASSGTRRPISMSVARSSTVVPAASSWTPERACTALRVEATREAVWSWASRRLGRGDDLHDEDLCRSTFGVIRGVQMCTGGARGRKVREEDAQPPA